VRAVGAVRGVRCGEGVPVLLFYNYYDCSNLQAIMSAVTPILLRASTAGAWRSSTCARGGGGWGGGQSVGWSVGRSVRRHQKPVTSGAGAGGGRQRRAAGMGQSNDTSERSGLGAPAAPSVVCQ
jgi:hypothetical protein